MGEFLHVIVVAQTAGDATHPKLHAFLDFGRYVTPDNNLGDGKATALFEGPKRFLQHAVLSQIEQVKGKIISGKGIGRDVIARFLAGISAMTKSATTESGGVTATLPAPLLHAKSAVTHVSDPG